MCKFVKLITKLKSKMNANEKIKEKFDSDLDFKIPMFVGILLFSLIFVCCQAQAAIYHFHVDTSIKDVTKNNRMDSQLCLIYNTYHEARSGSDMEMIMTMNTVMNRVHSDHYPNTICGVIKQKHQYEWTNDGRSDEMHDMKSVKRISKIVDKYLLNRELFLSLSQGADHYHHIAITPEWSLSPRMKEIGVIGYHKFYKRR